MQLYTAVLSLLISHLWHYAPYFFYSVPFHFFQVKTEVAQVVDMMREYLTKKGAAGEFSSLLNLFSQRLTLHSNHDDIHSDLQNLLDSLGNLTLSKSWSRSKHLTKHSNQETIKLWADINLSGMLVSQRHQTDVCPCYFTCQARVQPSNERITSI